MTDVFAPFTLPLRREGDAAIVDAAGKTVLVIDPDRDLEDHQAKAIVDHVFAALSTVPVTDDRTYYGKDCPVGMVQVEFVGCSPAARYSEYGWKPTKTAFIELYVDGQRYRIDAGDIGQNCFDGKPRRGVHINYPHEAALGDRSINALNLSNPGAEPFWRPSPDALREVLVRAEQTLTSIAAGARNHINGPAVADLLRDMRAALKGDGAE